MRLEGKENTNSFQSGKNKGFLYIKILNIKRKKGFFIDKCREEKEKLVKKQKQKARKLKR